MNRLCSTVIVCCVTAILSLCPTLMSGQGRSVAGRVTLLDDGRPAVHAKVQLKGEDNIYIRTDENGWFALDNVSQSATRLRVTYSGYRISEVLIAGADTVDVYLTPETREVVADKIKITALGVPKKTKEIGYTVASLSGEDLTQVDGGTLSSKLSGKVSGMSISTKNAESSVLVNFRAAKSIRGSNQAVLVIDGVVTPMDFFDSINPEDIENISIMKGASAAALYGLEAANGVVYITMKKR